MLKSRLSCSAVSALILVVSSSAMGQETLMDAGQIDPATVQKFFKKPGYSPYAGRNYPAQVFWGDEHVHTGWSVDAGMSGATLTPEDAVRFARGEEVLSSTGQPAKLGRPLDWIAVTDHSDGMGVISEIKAGNPELMADPVQKRWHDMMLAGPEQAAAATMELINAQANKQLPASIMDPKFAKSVWLKNSAIMEKYNEPGRFTAFIAYEWTSNAGGGNNLHRNVIYRDGSDKGDQMIPYTTFQSENPEDLWKWMANWEDKTGGSLLAIPHNGNLSNGRMFELKTFTGGPLTKEWAEARIRWEPLVEAIQTKGQSESHPSLSPTDEFAVGYELWDIGNLALVPKQPGMIEQEYAREALKNGLKLEAELGVNPFKFGLASGSDAHTGLAAMEEDNYFCKFVSCEPRPERWSEDAIKFGERSMKGWQVVAAGYTGVWATENTREALWDAMKRKETYSTSGSRMLVRFFGGFDFVSADADSRTPAEVGYGKGVPMGGDLHKAPEGKSPTFLVAALKDPFGGNLDRIQIIKGWVDKDGNTQEKIFDVVWGDADKRRPGADGKLPAVGNTVDVANAVWTNTIGDPELITVWTDPEFDPALRAFYYARVLEIPTPRWTAYDAKRFGVKMADNVPMVTQERAFTSPIWYTP
ncbi:DUF3604 domain-containing protein (plasmid) [Sinorhizobium medicae WSM1115]|uniref:DUF3604 domain-containing protein n=1 Tax=Sinorhizobium medicae TaxID=110321 RepID=UPI000477FC34|nr:DUF3604 domain-containing protein [Sinorhizobium medicae]UFX06593.1 DUF3604 domain-containing protein [Sinorhizobium medicae WSM1115]